jgi:hypothetical protein
MPRHHHLAAEPPVAFIQASDLKALRRRQEFWQHRPALAIEIRPCRLPVDGFGAGGCLRLFRVALLPDRAHARASRASRSRLRSTPQR